MRWMCVFSCMLLFQISAVAYSQKKVTYRQERGIIIIVPQEKSVEEKKARVEIIGKVTDEKGEPLSGVTVVIKGLGFGTLTDANGNYKLVVPNAPEKFSLLV